MTNAPLSDKSGSDSQRSSAAASTLVKVKVYDTKEAAGAEEADPIFVERLVGKVSVSIAKGITAGDSGNTVEVENPGSIYNGDRVVLEGWVLNVTNKSTRLVRDVGGLSEWVQYDSGDSRFLAGSAVKRDVGRYRIFWAVDCNYSDSNEHGESDSTYTTMRRTRRTSTGTPPGKRRRTWRTVWKIRSTRNIRTRTKPRPC